MIHRSVSGWWSEADSAELRRLDALGHSAQIIGSFLGRTVRSVENRLDLMARGTANEHRPWTNADMMSVVMMRAAGKTAPEIAAKLRRTVSSVKQKLSRMTDRPAPIVVVPAPVAVVEIPQLTPAAPPPVVLQPSRPGRIVRPVAGAAERRALQAAHAERRRFLPADWQSGPAVERVADRRGK